MRCPKHRSFDPYLAYPANNCAHCWILLFDDMSRDELGGSWLEDIRKELEHKPPVKRKVGKPRLAKNRA